MKPSTLSFIVRRLCFSGKNRGIVHIISLISLIGIAVGSFALIVVLSVFNGFTSVAEKMLEKTNPPVLVKPLEGKVLNSESVADIKHLQGVKTVIPIVKQTVMMSVGKSQTIVEMMGIDSSYFLYNPLDTCIVNGRDIFSAKDTMGIMMGVNLASDMGLNHGAENMNVPVKLTVPVPENKDAIVAEDMFASIGLFYGASFLTRSDLDNNTVFVPVQRARKLLSMQDGEVSYLYIIPKDKDDVSSIVENINTRHAKLCKAEDILQQQPLYFRIARSEKAAVYLILSFIVFIATVNIISSIIILHIQKERMNYILRSFGVTRRDLRKIYFWYGFTLNLLGCVLGVLIGLLFCFLQDRFGIIKLAGDAYVVDAFPVRIFLQDIIRVVLIVLIIGALAIKTVTVRIKIR